jgi:demethylmenaquinone methyltransferase/2-methoxy-6-polyprenyl-1,4-benzoquinol methylase
MSPCPNSDPALKKGEKGLDPWPRRHKRGTNERSAKAILREPRSVKKGNAYQCMLPHPSLTPHYADTKSKREFVNTLFNKGAAHYDGIAGWGFLHSGAAYRRWTQKRHGLRPGHRVLDVACGTGLVALEAAKILGSAESITCLDPSEGMLAVARQKLSATFVLGRAENMPFAVNSFDFLTMGYALRHVTSLEDTFREYHRVLKPGGKLLILEITKPAGCIGAFLFRLYFKRFYPFLTQLFTRSRDARDMMHYYWETMDACVPPTEVLAALRAAGLTEVNRISLMGLFSEYLAVKPALVLSSTLHH